MKVGERASLCRLATCIILETLEEFESRHLEEVIIVPMVFIVEKLYVAHRNVTLSEGNNAVQK
jgi:hypothetical protein